MTEDLKELRPETLAALMEFYKEREIEEKRICEDGHKNITEDWELSQFWYTNETSDRVMSMISKYSIKNNIKNIAILSAPSLYRSYLRNKNKFEGIKLSLFEYDKRFEELGKDFYFYDINDALNINQEHHHLYELLIADPPFLSEDAVCKTSQTIRLLSKNQNSDIIFLTGLIVKDYLIKEFPNIHLTDIPIYHDKLQNDFGLFSTFDLNI